MINVGIIGSSWTEGIIKRSIKRFPNFNPMFYTSNDIYDAIPFAEDAQKKCEVLLFSGYPPYQLVMDQTSIKIPAHYIPLKGTSLYRAFYELKRKVGRIHKVSVDTLLPDDIKQLNEDLTENVVSKHTDELVNLANIDRIVQFHSRLYDEGYNCAITGIKIVSDQLSKLQIPNQWILPTQGDVIVALERCLLATESRKRKESQIVLGLVAINNFSELISRASNEQHIQRDHLRVQNILIDFAETLEGHVTISTGNEYTFITNRGAFERVTEGYKVMPLFHQLSELGLNASVGIGFGETANISGNHARIALREAATYGENQCFIVKEDKSIIGPIKNVAPLHYPLQVTNQKIINRAKQANISPIYLEKITSMLYVNGAQHFTSNDLAKALEITRRSANRLINRLLDEGIVTYCGVEKVNKRGRPRQLFKLSDS